MTEKKPPNMPSVLLQGSPASGKSTALRTIIDAGLELFVIKTEPSEVLDDLPKNKAHWMYIPPATTPLVTQIKNAKLINALSFKALSGLEEMDRTQYQQYIRVLEGCNNFVDDRTGQPYGDVTTWGHDRAIVIDALSGLSQMALDMIVGGKPVKGKEQYGVAMSNIEDLVNYLATNTRCLFVLLAHTGIEPLQDAIGNPTALMVDTLGQKLAPKIPKYFSDVIHAKREGTEWSWSTLTYGMVCKARNVPWSDKIPPSFVPLVKTWRDRIAAGQTADDDAPKSASSTS